MNQNPMQLFQMFAQLRRNPNPMQMAQTMFGGNPLFSQAMNMCRGKGTNDIKTIVNNVAKEKGIDPNQLQQWASNFGLSL